MRTETPNIERLNFSDSDRKVAFYTLEQSLERRLKEPRKSGRSGCGKGENSRR